MHQKCKICGGCQDEKASNGFARNNIFMAHWLGYLGICSVMSTPLWVDIIKFVADKMDEVDMVFGENKNE